MWVQSSGYVSSDSVDVSACLVCHFTGVNLRKSRVGNLKGLKMKVGGRFVSSYRQSSFFTLGSHIVLAFLHHCRSQISKMESARKSCALVLSQSSGKPHPLVCALNETTFVPSATVCILSRTLWVSRSYIKGYIFD